MDEQALRAFLSLAQTENTRDTAAELAGTDGSADPAVSSEDATAG